MRHYQKTASKTSSIYDANERTSGEWNPAQTQESGLLMSAQYLLQRAFHIRIFANNEYCKRERAQFSTLCMFIPHMHTQRAVFVRECLLLFRHWEFCLWIKHKYIYEWARPHAQQPKEKMCGFLLYLPLIWYLSHSRIIIIAAAVVFVDAPLCVRVQAKSACGSLEQ